MKLLKLSTASIVLCCAIAGSANASISFLFDYSGNTAGEGFLHPLEGPARQAALVEAGNQFSNLFGSHFTHSGTGILTFAVTSSNDPGGTTLASAGTFSIPGAGNGFGLGEVVRNKLISGVDGNGASLDGFVDVNWGYLWELDVNTPADAGANEYDLYAALYHEFTHALGLGSNIGSGDRGNAGVWSKWDEFIADPAGNLIVDSNTFVVDPTRFDSAAASGGRFTGPNAVAAFGGNVPLVVDSDISHLNEARFRKPNAENVNFMMQPTRATGSDEARTWSALEVGILRDLGYSPVPEPSSAILSLFAMMVFVFRRHRHVA